MSSSPQPSSGVYYVHMGDDHNIEDIADNAEDDHPEVSMGDLVTDEAVYGEATNADGI